MAEKAAHLPKQVYLYLPYHARTCPVAAHQTTNNQPRAINTARDPEKLLLLPAMV